MKDGFLAGLEPSDMDMLTTWGPADRYRRGAMLFQEGVDADHMAIVRSGRVEVSRYTADAKEVVLVREPGELLGITVHDIAALRRRAT